MAGVANGSGITIAALKHNPGPACDGHEVPLLPLAPLGTRWHVAESDACGGQTSLTRESTRVIAGSPWRPEHPNRSPGRVPHPSSGAARRVSDCARPNVSPRRSGRQCATAARSCPPARPGQPRPVRAEGQGPDQTRMGESREGTAQHRKTADQCHPALQGRRAPERPESEQRAPRQAGSRHCASRVGLGGQAPGVGKGLLRLGLSAGDGCEGCLRLGLPTLGGDQEASGGDGAVEAASARIDARRNCTDGDSAPIAGSWAHRPWAREPPARRRAAPDLVLQPVQPR